MTSEEALITAFVEPCKRDRYLAFVGSPKNRPKFLSELWHFTDFDARFVQTVDSSQSPDDVVRLLAGHGAPETCELISDNAGLDGTTMTLTDAVWKVISDMDGTIISCIPDRLALYKGEENGELYLLLRPES